MDRLTERNDNGMGWDIRCRRCDILSRRRCLQCSERTRLYNRLADYEDAEEHGQLIKLPIPIGAKLYETYYCEGYGIIEWTIRGYEIDGAKMYFRADDGTSIDVSEMGDEFFETREQAEAKLVEWKKEWEEQNGQID